MCVCMLRVCVSLCRSLCVFMVCVSIIACTVVVCIYFVCLCVSLRVFFVHQIKLSLPAVEEREKFTRSKLIIICWFEGMFPACIAWLRIISSWRCPSTALSPRCTRCSSQIRVWTSGQFGFRDRNMNRNFSKTILQLDTGSGRRPLPVRSPNMTEFKPDLPFSISSPTASLLHLLVEDGLESKRSSAKRWRREAKRSGTWIWALDPRSTLLVHLRDVHNRTSHSSCSRAPTDYISQSVG